MATATQQVKVLKERKGVATVIEVNGMRYVLDLKSAPRK